MFEHYSSTYGTVWLQNDSTLHSNFRSTFNSRYTASFSKYFLWKLSCAPQNLHLFILLFAPLFLYKIAESLKAQKSFFGRHHTYNFFDHVTVRGGFRIRVRHNSTVTCFVLRCKTHCTSSKLRSEGLKCAKKRSVTITINFICSQSLFMCIWYCSNWWAST